MHSRLIALLLVALALVAAPFPPGTSAAPLPGEVVHEKWDLVKMGEARIGYSHSTTTRESTAEGDRLVTVSETVMKFVRLGGEAEIKVDLTWVEDADERTLKIRSITTMSSQPMVFDAVVVGDKLKVTSESLGRKVEQELPWDPEVASPMRLLRLDRELAGAAAGTVVKCKIFDPSVAMTFETTHERMANEKVTLQGTTLDAAVYKSTMLPGMTSTAWLTPEGDAFRTLQDMGGILIDFLSSTREEALGEPASGEAPPDVFTSSLLVSNVPIPRARQVDQALYRLTLKDPEADWPEIAEVPTQVFEKVAPDIQQLRITSRTPPAGRRQWPLTDVPEEIQECLRPSPMLQSDDDAVRQAALAAAGEEKDAWKAAQKLESWVYDHIEKKGMATVFASAAEVLSERTGDCSEHAVLLAALCRALGIPSRVAMGLEYVLGIFGGHAWVEVWIDGWYALDATNACGMVDAAHLTLAVSPMSDATGMAGFLTLAASLGAVDLHVLELRYGDQVIDLHQEPGLLRRDGARATWRGLGLAFDVPEGWTLEETAPSAGMSSELCEIEAPQGSDEIEVGETSVGGLFTLEELRQARGQGTWRPIEVDGRKGLEQIEEEADDSGQRRVFLLDQGSLFHFDLRFSSEASEKAFERFLKSVDLDPASG